jgi:hypothetical protein
VEADHHPGKSYAREGDRATMAVPGPHIRVNQIYRARLRLAELPYDKRVATA